MDHLYNFNELLNYIFYIFLLSKKYFSSLTFVFKNSLEMLCILLVQNDLTHLNDICSPKLCYSFN